jgi:hypothetical protein
MKSFLSLLLCCGLAQANPELSDIKKHLDFINGVKSVGVTDFTPHGKQPGLNHAITPANNCASCHGVSAPQDVEYTPTATWLGSMMANSLRDPLFWAAVDIANQDAPGVGDYCIRCHSPTGFYKGKTKNGMGDLEYANGCELDGTVNQPQDNNANDYQGVTCEFCHRIEKRGPFNEALITQNANIWLDDENCDNPNSSSFDPVEKAPIIRH